MGKLNHPSMLLLLLHFYGIAAFLLSGRIAVIFCPTIFGRGHFNCPMDFVRGGLYPGFYNNAICVITLPCQRKVRLISCDEK